MPRAWKMRRVTGHREQPNPIARAVTQIFAQLDCGHERRNGFEMDGRWHVDSYGPARKSVGDPMRCYECARMINGGCKEENKK